MNMRRKIITRGKIKFLEIWLQLTWVTLPWIMKVTLTLIHYLQFR